MKTLNMLILNTPAKHARLVANEIMPKIESINAVVDLKLIGIELEQ